MIKVLDPTSERQAITRSVLPRPKSLADKRVALLDISKPRGDIFLDRVEQHLQSLGIESQRYQKPTFARVAPIDLKHQIVSECDLVIEALAD